MPTDYTVAIRSSAGDILEYENDTANTGNQQLYMTSPFHPDTRYGVGVHFIAGRAALADRLRLT